MDLEWDADYDFKTSRMDASNIFADYRRDNVFGSVGYSTLQALNASFTSSLASQVTKYNLLRLLMGYGDPTKRGLSAGVNAGYDFIQNALQYGGIQSSYNRDCCGLPSNTAAWLWDRCETRINTASTSPWRGWAPREI